MSKRAIINNNIVEIVDYTPPVLTTEEIEADHQLAISDKWQEIKAERERRRTGGVLASGKWFDSDDKSRIQHLGMLMMGAGLPAGIMWKTMDDSFIEMTQVLVGSIFQALADADQSNFANAEVHRLAMEASADPAAYDYSAGWEGIYTI